MKANLANKPSENNEEPVLEFLNNTMEQMTIFQNKDIGQYRNIRLSKIQKDGADDFSDSDSGENQKKDGINRKYVKKLEITIENLNGKLTKAKKELEKVKQDNLSLQASIDNHVFINEKLNQAYKSLKVKYQKKKRKGSDERHGGKIMEGEIEINIGEDSGMANEHGIDKSQKMEATGGSSTVYQKATKIEDDTDFQTEGKIGGEVQEKEFGGDISSICIAPFEDDQIKGGQFTDFIGEDSV